MVRLLFKGKAPPACDAERARIGSGDRKRANSGADRVTLLVITRLKVKMTSKEVIRAFIDSFWMVDKSRH